MSEAVQDAAPGESGEVPAVVGGLTLAGMTANTCRRCWAEVDPSMRALHPRYCPGTPSAETIARLTTSPPPASSSAPSASLFAPTQTQAPLVVAADGVSAPVSRSARRQQPAAPTPGSFGAWLAGSFAGIPRVVLASAALVLAGVLVVAGMSNGWFAGTDPGCEADASEMYAGGASSDSGVHAEWQSYVDDCSNFVNGR